MSADTPGREKTMHPLRDAVLAGIITFVTSTLGLSVVYVKARDAQLDAVRGELLQLARATAAQVDGDLHRTLTSPSQQGSETHERLLAPLVRMHRATHDVWYVYTGIMRGDKIYWIVDSANHYRVKGNDLPADPIMTEYTGNDTELRRAFRERTEHANSEPYMEDGHGYLSAFAPVRDRAGSVVAMLCVEMVMDALDARMSKIRWALGAAFAVVLAMSVVAGAITLYLRRFAAQILCEMREARAQAEAHAATAEAATRAKATFLAMMSHEIRTPMNGILGVADLLRTMSPEPPQTKLLDILAGSGQSLLRVIDDILDFSKIDAERLELQPRPFELRGLLDEIEHLLATQARGKNVTFVLNADTTLPVALNGDRQRLSQVLLNLGTNAVKFTDHGEVRFSVRVLGKSGGVVRIEFAMQDTGIGISPEALQQLFKPFTQLADVRRHVRGGTGLGLVIAQRLVGLMGSEIRVVSEFDKGSTFSFAVDLPIAEAPSAVATTAVRRLESLSILVAEDNVVNQTVITAMLRQLGHFPTLAATGREALDALIDEDFDAVLMDCNMPVMDGMEATKHIRGGTAGVRHARIPVIALTANAMEGDRELCLAAGMDDFLTKPVTLAALRDALDRTRDSRLAAREESLVRDTQQTA
jgi:signal transduction histidine kinase/CheY-like chemotaxis protein